MRGSLSREKRLEISISKLKKSNVSLRSEMRELKTIIKTQNQRIHELESKREDKELQRKRLPERLYKPTSEERELAPLGKKPGTKRTSLGRINTAGCTPLRDSKETESVFHEDVKGVYHQLKQELADPSEKRAYKQLDKLLQDTPEKQIHRRKHAQNQNPAETHQENKRPASYLSEVRGGASREQYGGTCVAQSCSYAQNLWRFPIS